MAAEGRPALIHCVNGKDRTGVLCRRSCSSRRLPPTRASPTT
ncbi:tyrosine-protein phosphatase [Adlercreutzia rubneri]|nr:tyrosine-protein phosphatase [Adlercreutzia rubneri]MDE8685337.1 tyrosine-protein phosphatase [Adlercreutzia rubneri]